MEPTDATKPEGYGQLSDLQRSEVDTALEHGFDPVPDPPRGPGWFKFRKGDVFVWLAYRGWMRATYAADRYKGHTRHVRLKDALQGVHGVPLATYSM